MQIAIDDTKLEIHTAGEGDAVVLLHGFPFSNQIWKTQIDELAKTHFVIAPDFRGLGKSGVTTGPYLMETLAGDVAAILDALDVERVSLVGHSLGGYVCLAFFRMFSERVRRLCLVCSRIDADTPEVAAARMQLADATHAGGMQPIVDAYDDTMLGAAASAELREFVRGIMMQTPAAGAAAVLRGMAQRVDSHDLLDELAIPVLILTGGRDAISPAKIWEPIMPQLAGARLAVCEASAHLPMLEQPGRFNEYLVGFLR
ncbi:MAG: alpha/beta fold hydrolase [Vulcanimicrobiaceae bacterium]